MRAGSAPNSWIIDGYSSYPFIGGLSAGTSFVLDRSAGSTWSLDGRRWLDVPLWGAFGDIGWFNGEVPSVVIDGQNNVFALSNEYGAGHLNAFSSDGGPLWNLYLFDTSSPIAGPVLGGNRQLYILSVAAPVTRSNGPVELDALDDATGTRLWSFSAGPVARGLAYHPDEFVLQQPTLLLTAQGTLVFSTGKAVFGVATGSGGPPSDAPWPEPNGGPGSQNAAYSP